MSSTTIRPPARERDAGVGAHGVIGEVDRQRRAGFTARHREPAIAHERAKVDAHRRARWLRADVEVEPAVGLVAAVDRQPAERRAGAGDAGELDAALDERLRRHVCRRVDLRRQLRDADVVAVRRVVDALAGHDPVDREIELRPKRAARVHCRRDCARDVRGALFGEGLRVARRRDQRRAVERQRAGTARDLTEGERVRVTAGAAGDDRVAATACELAGETELAACDAVDDGHHRAAAPNIQCPHAISPTTATPTL